MNWACGFGDYELQKLVQSFVIAPNKDMFHVFLNVIWTVHEQVHVPFVCQKDLLENSNNIKQNRYIWDLGDYFV